MVRGSNVKELIGQEVDRAEEERLLDICEELVESIWLRIVHTVGGMTAMTIAERALAMTAELHPLIRKVQVSGNGFSFSALRGLPDGDCPGGLREGLKAQAANLIDIMEMLTGDLLLASLVDEIEKRKRP